MSGLNQLLWTRGPTGDRKIKTLSKLAGALAALAALISLAAAPASAQNVGPTDFAYDNFANELVGTYTAPNIANSTDFVTGSTSKPIVSKIAVIVIFSGSGWTDPKFAGYLPGYVSFLTNLFNSPYFTLLTQYGSINIDYATRIVDSSSASVSGAFTDAKLQTFVNLYLTRNISIPAGYRPFYLVIPTPGSGIPGVTEGGEHFQYTAPGGVSTIAGWATSTQAIAHEIVETITDPAPNANWQMDRSYQGTEIADAGQAVADMLPGTALFGENLVGPYWSQSERACVIPVGSPRQAAGDSLTSYFDGTSTHVFYVGLNRHVYELIGTGSPATWTTDDPLAIAGGALTRGGTGLTSFWDPIGQVGHVFYLGPSSDVEELYHLNGSSWFPNDLEVGSFQGTPLPAHPQIEGDRALSGFFKPADDTEHVYYADNQLGISEFKWTPTTGWITAPVSTQLGIGSQLSALEDGTEHVFYKDGNGHVRESAWNGTAWQSTDWSALYGSTLPLPGNDALATVADPGSVDNVFYIDTAGQIRQLVRFNGVYWNFDLTSGLPAASLPGSPVLSCIRDGSGNVHLFYIGQDSEVHEFVRTLFQTMTFGTPGGVVSTIAVTWAPMDTPATPVGRPYTLSSRLLTSCLDSAHQASQVFALSAMFPSESVSYAPIAGAANSGSGWTASLPSTQANAPVAFP